MGGLGVEGATRVTHACEFVCLLLEPARARVRVCVCYLRLALLLEGGQSRFELFRIQLGR